MKVLLVLPPQWIWHRPYLSSPYLSLPSLAAYLKANGYQDVVQKDLNLESYDLMLSEEYLSGLQDRLDSSFKKLDSQPRLDSTAEKAFYHDLFRAKNSVEEIAPKIAGAKAVFRSQDYYDIKALYRARKTLDGALSIISAAYFPTNKERLWSTAPPFQGSLADLQAITRNRDENPFIELFEKTFIPAIAEERPDVICISIVNHSQLIPALTLGRMLKKALPGIPVVVGGGVVTLLAETLKNHPGMFEFFDIAVLYEGEAPLLELVKRLEVGSLLDDSPNLVFVKDGKITATEVRPAVDINLLPTPDFSGLPLAKYLTPDLILPVISSRGCYWGKCAFCANCETYQWRYQKRDEAKMADDLETLSQRYGARHFAFSDECLSPSEFSRLSEEIEARQLDVRCWAQARLERQFTPELCRRISQAGFKLLLLGLESGCDRVLAAMNKGLTKETAAAVCRNLHEAGIWNHLYAFFGFPTETRAEAQETIDFLLSNNDIVSSFNIDSFIVGSGSSARRHPDQFGITDVNAGGNDDLDLAFDYKVASGMSHAEADALSKQCEKAIGDTYATREVMNRLAQDDVLLYLSHYEDQDPMLRSIVPAKPISASPFKELTSKSMPRVKNGVILDKLQFDLSEIGRHLEEGNRGAIYPKPGYVIFIPASSKSSGISLQAVEVLALCDGKRSIKQISYELAKRYEAPRGTIEGDCIALLRPMAAERFISVSEP